jgi:hypothetical protein
MKSPVQVTSSEIWGTTPTSTRSWRRPSPTSTACSGPSQQLPAYFSSPSLSALFTLFCLLNHKARMPRRYYFCVAITLLMLRRNNNSVQIINKLDFFPKKANMAYFFIYFCDVLLKFQPVLSNFFS